VLYCTRTSFPQSFSASHESFSADHALHACLVRVLVVAGPILEVGHEVRLRMPVHLLLRDQRDLSLAKLRVPTQSLGGILRETGGRVGESCGGDRGCVAARLRVAGQPEAVGGKRWAGPLELFTTHSMGRPGGARVEGRRGRYWRGLCPSSQSRSTAAPGGPRGHHSRC